MKILSLCSGYGGLDLAVEEHFNAQTVYWSDIDQTSCLIMGTRFPEAEPIGDLTLLGDTIFDVDIITAGYPCQPWSLAGRREGENDTQGRHLWPYIANTISVSRPRWAVLENVAGHLTLGGTAVIRDLASMGYLVRWGTLRASDAGAPHQRKRLFIVANTDSTRLQRRWSEQQLRKDGRKEEVGWGYQDFAHTPSAEWGRSQHEYLAPSIGSTTKSGECVGTVEWGDYELAIRRWEHILGREAPSPVTDGKLSAHFVEWMMGCDQGWVCDLVESRAKALKVLGNGVVKQQCALALNLI